MVSSQSSHTFTIILLTILATTTLPSLICAKPPPPPVEHFLALQWGFTVCNQNPRCKSTRIPTDFMIHGYWMIGQPNTANCKGDEFGDIALVSGLKGDLNMYWIDAEFGDNQKLWRHEYNSHGVCDNGTVYSYFHKVLFKAYNPRILRLDSGKKVQKLFSSKHTINEGVLYSGLKGIINKGFGMICKYDQAARAYKLQELRLQFTESGKQLTMVDLAQMPGKTAGRCPTGADIMLPHE